jgi:TIR domain-containing protein
MGEALRTEKIVADVEFREYEYQVALSFAGEQRAYVQQVAAALAASGISYFYDDDQRIPLWGKNLAEELQSVYMDRSRAVVIFISKEYAEKSWTRHERRSAVSRALRERGEYVLPVRFDAIDLPGLDPALSYLNAGSYTPAELAGAIAEKLASIGDGSAPEGGGTGRVPRHWFGRSAKIATAAVIVSMIAVAGVLLASSPRSSHRGQDLRTLDTGHPSPSSHPSGPSHSSGPASSTAVLLKENFANKAAGWTDIGSSRGGGRYTKGGYVLYAQPGGYGTAFPSRTGSLYPTAPESLEISLTVRLAANSASSGYVFGTGCRVNNVGADYVFVMADGYVSIQKILNARRDSVYLADTPAAFVRAGGTYRIQADCDAINADEATQLKFTVNGRTLASATDTDNPLGAGTVLMFVTNSPAASKVAQVLVSSFDVTRT